MRGAIPPLPQYAFMAWCSVKKHRGNFTFTFTLIGILHTFQYIKYFDFHAVTFHAFQRVCLVSGLCIVCLVIAMQCDIEM